MGGQDVGQWSSNAQFPHPGSWIFPAKDKRVERDVWQATRPGRGCKAREGKGNQIIQCQ